MKKTIIAAAIILTAGIVNTFTKNNNVKAPKASKSLVVLDRNVLATAD